MDSSNLGQQNKLHDQTSHHDQPTLEKQQSTSNIFSLTLDEFQQNMVSNKNLGSMNMDEFLNSICNVEDNHNNNEDGNNLFINPSTDSKVLPPTLSLKTVDEVWSEIYPTVPPPSGGNPVVNDNITQRQTTFGEMTLEDFLVKAGVVREGNTNNKSGSSSNSVENQLRVEPGQLNFPKFDRQQPVLMGHGGGNSVNLGSVNGGGFVPAVGDMPNSGMYIGVSGSRVGKDVEYGAGQMLHRATPGRAGAYYSNQGDQSRAELEMGRGTWRGRKRCRSSKATEDDDGAGPVEKVVERRQRRMIKNREAASRSRARKQAYTVELEAALDQLKEENARLNQTLVREMKGLKGKHFGKAQATTPTAKLKMLGRMWSLPLISYLTK
ncbi:hypothetical protein C5167_000313 [Papaver somniferum]|uniref:BZIP domain-containing protein n=1 Tax=Papaver somniferum TaxID=3469 RepID=A0A4Y7KVR6_PAPSO|nr:protein ABSCISIC ACID-INSENSITIVE 5-like [Papaver somniferum]RZC76211.1 hypothetical protein C5167_000313 [Papaver somniferum]